MPAENKLYGLDHLRALAIIMVFVFHYGRLFPHPEWTNEISSFGWTGVDLFFVLSGYLISSQLFARLRTARNISIGTFYVKRFFRIIPLYLLIVAIYFWFPAVREREGLAPAWKYLSFTQNYGLDLRRYGTFSHAWSLCIEEQFYFCLPLLLACLVHVRLFRNSYWILAVLVTGGMVIRYFSYHHFVSPYLETDEPWGIYWFQWIYYPTHCRLDGLLTGIAVAALLEYRPTLRNRLEGYGNQLLLLSIAVLTAAYFVCEDELSLTATVFGFPLVALGYGLMVMSAVCPSSILYQFKSPVTTTIAMLSYAIYLSHKMVIHLAQEIFANSIAKDGNTAFILSIAFAVVVALLLNKIIEQPFLRLRTMVIARLRRKDL